MSSCVPWTSLASLTGNLPKTRTEDSKPFQVIGVDFAGPIRYTSRAKTESKAYLVLYAYSLTRAVHLHPLKSLETFEFMASLKQFIAQRGRPEIIYSQNGSTFKAAENWLKKVQQDERFHELLAGLTINYQPLQAYTTIGNGTPRWAELEVVLDVDVEHNNRPLRYLEEDVQLPVLTPNSMLHINPKHLPELQTHDVPDKDPRKRAKLLLKFKEVMCKRWATKYVRSLREITAEQEGSNDHANNLSPESLRSKINWVTFCEGIKLIDNWF